MNKKILSILIAILMLISTVTCSVINISAEELTKITFEGKEYSVSVGSTFTVATTISCSTPVAGGRVIYRFDTSMVELVERDDVYSSNCGSALTVGGYTADGTGCSFAFASTTSDTIPSLSGDSPLVEFYFRAKSAGNTTITFDSSSYEISVFGTDGNITNAVVGGNVVNGGVGYSLVGNTLTIADFEAESTTEAPSKQSDNSAQTGTSTIKTDTGYTVTINSGKATVMGGNNTSNVLFIPDSVTDENGNSVTVTDIATDAFLNSAAKTIYIPATVTNIPEHSVGYALQDGEYVKIDGFTIYGHKGSAAEQYATDNGFTFVNYDETPLAVDDPTLSTTEKSNSVVIIVLVVCIVLALAVVAIVVIRKKNTDKTDANL